MLHFIIRYFFSPNSFIVPFIIKQFRIFLALIFVYRDLFRKRSCRKSKRRSCSPLGTACLSGNGATNPCTPMSMGPTDMSECPTPPSSIQNRCVIFFYFVLFSFLLYLLRYSNTISASKYFHTFFYKFVFLFSPRKIRGTRTSASLKVKGLLGRVWARDSKSKSCENLHVL